MSVNYENVDQYFYDLGKFISVFSIVEHLMQTLVMSISGIEYRTGQAVFSGAKINQSNEYINSIYRSRNIEVEPKLKSILDQVKVINHDRNIIIHHGLSIVEDLYIATNAKSAYSADRVKGILITKDTLANMLADSETIIHGLQPYVRRPDLSEEEFSKMENDLTLKPWLYKSQQLKHVNHTKKSTKKK